MLVFKWHYHAGNLHIDIKRILPYLWEIFFSGCMKVSIVPSPYDVCVYTHIYVIQFNLQMRHSKGLTTDNKTE